MKNRHSDRLSFFHSGLSRQRRLASSVVATDTAGCEGTKSGRMDASLRRHDNVAGGFKSMRGFTLIEVMFAFLILVSIAGMFAYMQTQSMRRKAQGDFLITATQLARKKMIDCKYDLIDQNKGGGFGYSDYKNDGTFDDEGYPEFKWTCEAPYLKIPVPNLDAVGAKKDESGGVSTDPIISMIGAIFGPLITAIGDCARELVTVVKWKRGSTDEELRITTHVIDREKFAQLVAAFRIPPL